jgi:hypothetical protein
LIRDAWDNLTPTDSDDNEEDANDRAEIRKPQLVDLFHKCRSLIKIVRRSQILTAYVDLQRTKLGLSRRLVLDCRSRWNSTYLSLSTLLDHKQAMSNLFASKRQLILPVKQKETLGGLELSSDDWAIVSYVIQILDPFYQATQLLSGSKYPTIGLCLFAIRNIREFLEAGADDEASIVANLKGFLLDSFNQYFNDQDDQYTLMKVITSCSFGK